MRLPWGKKTSSTIVVVDIRSSSVSAGYVVLEQGKQPHLVHAVQYPVDPHATEPLSDAMPRTLETVLSSLASTGAVKLSALHRSTKNDHVLITVSSPWQQSHIGSAKMEKEKSFTFTHALLDDMTADMAASRPGRTVVSQLVLSTFLNGYETVNAFGREATHVEAITLTTDIEDTVYNGIREVVKKTFHHNHIDVYAFLPELYAVLRDVLPAQRDYLVFDIGSDVSDILLVKHGLLVANAVNTTGMRSILDAVHKSGLSSHSIPTADHTVFDSARNSTFQDATTQAKNDWLLTLKETLTQVAKEEPLPRLLCVISEPALADFTKRLLDAPILRSLWLSDEPLPVLSLTSTQLDSVLTHELDTIPPFPLCILAVSCQKRYQ